jgi:hypothetical protein
MILEYERLVKQDFRRLLAGLPLNKTGWPFTGDAKKACEKANHTKMKNVGAP